MNLQFNADLRLKKWSWSGKCLSQRKLWCFCIIYAGHGPLENDSIEGDTPVWLLQLESIIESIFWLRSTSPPFSFQFVYFFESNQSRSSEESRKISYSHESPKEELHDNMMMMMQCRYLLRVTVELDWKGSQHNSSVILSCGCCCTNCAMKSKLGNTPPFMRDTTKSYFRLLGRLWIQDLNPHLHFPQNICYNKITI
jgi:hypothetical protein